MKRVFVLVLISFTAGAEDHCRNLPIGKYQATVKAVQSYGTCDDLISATMTASFNPEGYISPILFSCVTVVDPECSTHIYCRSDLIQIQAVFDGKLTYNGGSGKLIVFGNYGGCKYLVYSVKVTK